MKSFFRIVLIAVCYFIFHALPVSAQIDNPKYEFGAGISSFVYQGDLTPNRLGSYETLKPGFQLHGSLILSPSFMARTNITYGSLRADDGVYDKPAFRQQRNFNFKTPVLELSELLVWNPMKSNYEDKGFSPYIMGGIGVSFLNIKKDYSQFNPDYFNEGALILQQLAEDDANGVPGLIAVVPLGAGVRYALSPAFAVYAESAYRLMFTDYLDGFSKATDPKWNDHYQTISIGIIYRPGRKGKLACPAVNF